MSLTRPDAPLVAAPDPETFDRPLHLEVRQTVLLLTASFAVCGLPVAVGRLLAALG